MARRKHGHASKQALGRGSSPVLTLLLAGAACPEPDVSQAGARDTEQRSGDRFGNAMGHPADGPCRRPRGREGELVGEPIGPRDRRPDRHRRSCGRLLGNPPSAPRLADAHTLDMGADRYCDILIW